MANPHNRKPLYYRSSNPGLSQVDSIASNLFQFNETGALPAEVVNGKAFMPPAEITGESMIWSDSYTLGYSNQADSAPMFWSNGTAGDVKLLEIINHVANRLGQPLFSDLVAAKAWAESASGIYTSWAASTPASPSYSIGDTSPVLLTYIIENNTSRNIMAIMPGGHTGTITQTPSPYVSGPYDTEVAWLPLVPGSSVTITNVAGYDTTGGANPEYGHFIASLQSNFAFAPAPTALTAYVNGDLAFTGTPYTTNGHTSSIYRPGNNYVQTGDIVRFVYS